MFNTQGTREMDDKKTVCWYNIGIVSLSIFLFAGSALVGKSGAGLISSVFHIVCSWVYVYGWQVLVRRSPEILPKYFLAASALRLMGAAMVLLVFCVVYREDVEAIKWFAVVFIIFYMVILAFDAIFFAKVSNNKKVTK